MDDIILLISNEIKRQYKSFKRFSEVSMIPYGELLNALTNRVSRIPYGKLSYAFSNIFRRNSTETIKEICRFLNLKEALNAFEASENALTPDEKYGKELLNEAMMLRRRGELKLAMIIVNHILDSYYAADEVIAFKMELMATDEENPPYIDENEDLVNELANELDNYCYEIANDNDLLYGEEFYDVIEECGKAYRPDDFLEKMMTYCRKKYASLGEEKVRGEYIITSFYGAICAALFYFEDDTIYDDCDQYEFLKDHIDIEFTDRNAERMLQTKAGEEKAEQIRSIISPYVKYAHDIFNKTSKLSDKLILCAMKNAYEIGMLTANYYHNGRDKKHILGTRTEIDAALSKLAASQSRYKQLPCSSAMCYSPIPPSNVTCICEKCGDTFTMKVGGGFEKFISEYRRLAKEFVELGHKANVTIVCKSCAKQFCPHESLTWHIVFTFVANGSTTPVYSYPSIYELNTTAYEIALSFLKGAETISKLSADTHTHLSSSEYLKLIKEVIGIMPNHSEIL